MNKLCPTAFLTAGLILLSGCSAKDSSSSDTAQETPISSSAEYKTGTFTTYQLTNFSFTISDDFADKHDTDSRDKVPGAMTFDNELFDHITIDGYESLYEDTACYGELQSAHLESLGFTDVSYELIDLDGFQASVIDHIDKWNGEDKIWSTYTAICEGRKFSVFAIYSIENKDKAAPMLNDIIHSAVYTSDYRLPTEQQEYETEAYSISFGPEWVRNSYKSESAMKDDGLVCSDQFQFARSTNNSENWCSVVIEAGEDPEGMSAAQKADQRENNSIGSSFTYSIDRSQTEMFGKNTETVCCKMDSGQDTAISEYRFFEHDGNLFQIKLMYLDDDRQEEILQRVNDLLSNITLK